MKRNVTLQAIGQRLFAIGEVLNFSRLTRTEKASYRKEVRTLKALRASL